MCTYVYVCFVTGFLSFFVPLGPLTLIEVHGICRKSAAMPQCRGLVRTLQYLSNYPDLVGISAILLEIPSPESRPKCDRDRKKSGFWHLFRYFISCEFLWYLHKNRVYLKLISKKKKNETWAPGSSTCTRRHANTNRHENNNCFIEHFRQQFPLRTLKMPFQRIKISILSGGARPFTPPPPSPLPPPPSDSRLQHSRDSSVIEEYLDFTYSKGWTVW